MIFYQMLCFGKNNFFFCKPFVNINEDKIIEFDAHRIFAKQLNKKVAWNIELKEAILLR